MIEELVLNYLPPPFDNKYVVASVIFAVFFLISKFGVFIASRILLSISKRTKTKLDDMLIEKTNSPISWLLLFIGIKIAFEYLDFSINIAYYLNNAVDSLIYISIGIVLISFLVTLIDHWGISFAKRTQSTMDDALIPLFRRSTKVAVMIIISIMVLDLWGVNVTGLLAGVGIAGIAIGFAVKDSLANIFGGVSLILDKTIHVGDKIELADKTVGVVEDVGIRATRVRTPDNELVIVPNGSLSNMMIKNYNLPDPTTRVSVPFSVQKGADPEDAKRLALAEIRKMQGLMAEPVPSAALLDVTDTALNFKAFFWVDDTKKSQEKREEALIRLYNAFNKKSHKKK